MIKQRISPLCYKRWNDSKDCPTISQILLCDILHDLKLLYINDNVVGNGQQ